MKPFVSVVIPCRNEATSLARCLQSILASDYPADRMEILVADGMSDDASRAIAGHSPRVRVIDNPDRITPIALNRAIQASRGDFILRVDAHSVVGPSYISTLINFLLDNPTAWGAGGRMFTKPETQGPFSKPISIVLSHRFGVGNSRFRTGGTAVEPVDTIFNCCWRREVFQKVGFFHEQLVRSQDIEFSSRIARAGGMLFRVPAAETTYFARTRFASYLRHNWSNGIWSILPALYLGRLPVSWRHLVPLAFVASLVLSLPIAPLAVAVPYAIANLLASAHAAVRHRDPSLLLTLPISFAALHLAYGAGSLWGIIRLLTESLQSNDTRTNPIHPIL